MIKKTAKSIYLIGIGGIGMSALARYYKERGYRVTGSDVAASQITASLRKEGIAVNIGHTAGNMRAVALPGSLVVYNRAIPADNQELVAARKLGLRTIPYAQALGELTQEYRTIAITGSHGKSTTTAFAGLTLITGSLDPMVLIGTNLKEFGGRNFRPAKKNIAAAAHNQYLVLEADDFGGAFWAYSPSISIVTNIDREHLDFYKNLSGVKNGFIKFIAQTIAGGTLILNQDDRNLYSLRSKIATLAKKKKWRVVWYSITASHGNLSHEAQKIKKVIKIPGEHNLSNAMAAYKLGEILKINEKKTLVAIGAYHGAWRRMEYRGDLKITGMGGDRRRGKIPVYDDYAHHPTEITATLQAFREKFPHIPLVCIFQPHQAKRLKALFKEFTSSFSDADVLAIIPSYTVAGRDDADRKFTAEQLAQAIKKHYPKKPIFYIRNPKDIKKFLNKKMISWPNCCYKACLIMMGAGDIVQYTDSLLA